MGQSKIQSLDGIRGMAAVFVLFSHVFLWFDPYLHGGARRDANPSAFAEGLFNSPFTFFYKGEAAVWIFFVLSGFVLSYGLLKKKGDISAIRTAAEKRYFRLGAPVFSAILIGYILMSLGVFKGAEFGLTNNLSQKYTYSGSFLEAITHGLWGSLVLGENKYDYVLWTISIELYGSFLIFGLIALFGRSLVILRSISVILIIVCMGGSNSMLSSMGLFSFGLLLASFPIPKTGNFKKTVVALILLTLGLYLAGYNPHSDSYSTMVDLAHLIQDYSGWKLHWPHLYPQIGTCFIVTCLLISPRIFKPLERNVFQWLGRISFSFYLLHSFVLAMVAPHLTVAFPKYEAMTLTLAISLPLTLIISQLFYKYVDKPSTLLARRISYSQHKDGSAKEHLQTAP